MKFHAVLISACLLCALTALVAQVTPAPAEAPRFLAVDIYVNSGTEHLAAYQLEFWASNSTARVVGVEGGEHAAFKEAPAYDPKAIQQERVIIAAFNTAAPDQLPQGKTRVATIHMQTTGATPVFHLRVEVAGNSQGERINAQASFNERTRP